MKTVRVHIQSLPAYTPPGVSLFLAGNFNQWQPGDQQYRFRQNGDGSYSIDFQLDIPVLEYKITRGNWSEAEGDHKGSELPNRVSKLGFAENDLWVRVESWTDMREQARRYGNPGNVLLLHPHFYIPQLGRHRRIWACLPPDYWTSGRRYPVVYMQDGQNLFDNPGAAFGSWGIDQALNRLFLQPGGTSPEVALQPIFIGIENGGVCRINEYSPWKNPEHGGGEGAQYLDFVCNTLKPFVDEHLRTQPGREQTGIMGSSMGALISLFAAVERPDVFGMAGVFSPSLWFSPEILPFVQQRSPSFPQKILLMAGQQESKTMVGDLLDLYETLLEAGHDDHNLHYDLHSDGVHAEWFWAREFEHALRWLFGDMPAHTHGVSGEFIQFQLDEKSKQLIVSIDNRLQQPLLEVRDYCHYREFRHPLRENFIPYADWENCLYAIRLLSGGDLVFSRRVHLNQVETVKAPRKRKIPAAKRLAGKLQTILV
ncbi:MAG: hypothetical protein IPJ82_14845 [Lewinellaceae bacterium]|nr:hypothetical protein [Lewinellaceae bacterium]